jgi:hypothetical protein
MSTVHVFRCSADPSLYCYTADRTGDNLPHGACGGKWIYFRQIAVSLGETRSAVSIAAMLNGIEQTGYHLFSTATRGRPEFDGARQTTKQGEAGTQAVSHDILQPCEQSPVASPVRSSWENARTSALHPAPGE